MCEKIGFLFLKKSEFYGKMGEKRADPAVRRKKGWFNDDCAAIQQLVKMLYWDVADEVSKS